MRSRVKYEAGTNFLYEVDWAKDLFLNKNKVVRDIIDSKLENL